MLLVQRGNKSGTPSLGRATKSPPTSRDPSIRWQLMQEHSGQPGRLAPMEVFDAIRAGVANDRSQFYKDLAMQFYGANRPGAKVSQAILDQFWLWSMQAGALNAYEASRHFPRRILRRI
jgi:hypothetical protein